MTNFLTDEQIDAQIRKLNECNSPYRQWVHRKAQKNHIDLFGMEIKEGDYYYRLNIDSSYSNDLKLSCMNMDKFLYALFAPYPSWELDAENSIKKRFDNAREIINKLRP